MKPAFQAILRWGSKVWSPASSAISPVAARRQISDIVETRESAYVELGLGGEAKRVSPAAGERLGYPPEALAGRNVAEFLHPDDRETVLAAVSALWSGRLADGAALRCRVRRRDSVWMALEAKLYLIRDERRAPVTAVAVLRDLTQQIEAERSLEAREALLSAVSEVSGVGGWEWRPEADEVFCTPVARKIMGAEAGDQPCFSFFMSALEPVDRPRVERAIRAALEQGEPWSLDLAATVRGGVRRILRLTGAVQSRNGAPILIGGVQDITEDRKAREELRTARDAARIALREAGAAHEELARAMAQTEQMRQRLLDAVEAMPDGFALYDAEDRLVLCNTRFREIHRRWGADIAPGASFESLLRARVAAGDMPEAQGREEEWIAERIAQRRPGVAFERRTADGLWLRVVDRETSEGGVVSLRIDMTEQKQQQNWLAVALDAAEEAGEAQSQFLATMSHEIRTPLNGVIGMLELMALDDLALEQRRRVRIAGDSARHLLRLLNDLLDFSKLEAGKLELESIPLRLRPLAEDVAALFDGQAKAKGVKLQCVFDPALPEWVSSDPMRLRQIISNLVSNAVKFTERGHAELALSWSATAAESGLLRIVVSDTGIGVPAEARDRLFQRFSQADQGVARRFGGAGLGLAICRQIAFRMGGRIWLDAASEKGSVFVAELPLTLSARSTAGQRASARMQRNDTPQIIMVIRDDACAARVAVALDGVARCRRAESIDTLAHIARAGEVGVCIIEPALLSAVRPHLRAAPGPEAQVAVVEEGIDPAALRALVETLLRRAAAAAGAEAEFQRLLHALEHAPLVEEHL